MPSAKHNIIDSLHRHIARSGGNYRQWYVGTCTTDRQDVLDVCHGKRESVFLRKACSSEDARAVIAYFVYIYSTKRGKTIGAVKVCDVVYAYTLGT